MVLILVPFKQWNLVYRQRICKYKDLERKIPLSKDEKEFFEKVGDKLPFPLSIPESYLRLAGSELDDPIRLQCIPRKQELETVAEESLDPLEDQEFSPVPRLVHRYWDRALLLVTDQCGLSCRFCFRRHFAGNRAGIIQQHELHPILNYLKKHPEIKELILSGGDPLTLSDERFFALVDTLRFSRPGILLRVSSRMPIAIPSRITRRFVYGLKARRPFWFILHVNHPRELSPEAGEALNRLVDGGVPILSQTVLLRGVNDTVEVLEELFHKLAAQRIKPYYLFQGDLARGTSHFRVPISKGLELMRELRNRVSSLSLPVYAVDLPGGGGKVPLTESYLKGEDQESYIFLNTEGREFRYPKEM